MDFKSLNQFFNNLPYQTILKAVIIAVCGLIIIRIITAVLKRTVKKKISQQSFMLINKIVIYSGLFIVILTVLSIFNIDLTALLGAAGIAGLTIGVASKNSVGNIISGIFLISEKSFQVGDVVKIGDKTGIVYSIDLLSIKLRTFDNLFVRIPNENIINSDVTTVTRFPIRRMDINISVPYDTDLEKVKNILLSAASENPLCLTEPEPLFVYNGFGEKGCEILLGMWFEKTSYLQLKNSIIPEIKKAFEKEKIEFAYPALKIHTK